MIHGLFPMQGYLPGTGVIGSSLTLECSAQQGSVEPNIEDSLQILPLT